jgi:GNAT superfamily N-acetyltransferase
VTAVSEFPQRIVIRDLGDDSQVVDQLVAWQVAEYATTIPSFDHDAWSVFYRDWTTKADADLPVVLAGYDDGVLFGTVAVVERDDLDDVDHWTPWIASMVVRPDLRGEGRGLLLLEAALDRCRQLGVRKVYLWTEHRQAWYSRLGWSIEEEREFRGVPITVMSLELN